jgi:hypothetical protein
MRFSLLRFRSPLLTESRLFSLPAGTEMFHFPAFPPHTLCIQMRVTRHHARWVPPFGHPRITARLAAPRGLSQPTTSFIGSWCQGIHRVLLHTYTHKTIKDARVHCAVLKQHTPTPPTPGTNQASRESVPARNNGVVSDTQQCAPSGPHSPHPPALSREGGDQDEILRDSVPPN